MLLGVLRVSEKGHAEAHVAQRAVESFQYPFLPGQSRRFDEFLGLDQLPARLKTMILAFIPKPVGLLETSADLLRERVE
jgi:hypothetical protein